MKKYSIATLLLIVSLSQLAGQSWIRHYSWEDVCPYSYTNTSGNVYNVIPALGGGYLLQGHAEFIYASDEYDAPVMMTNIFWKIDENGEVVWRRIHEHFTPYNIVLSNGIDRYYCIASYQGYSCMDVFDSELNHLEHYSFPDQNGFDASLNDAVIVDDGLVFAGKISYKPTVIKTNFQFEVTWQSQCRNLSSLSTSFDSVSITNDGSFTALINLGDAMYKCSSEGDSLWTFQITQTGKWFEKEVSHSNGNSYVIIGNGQLPNYIVTIVSLDGSYIDEYDTGISLAANTGGIEECPDGGIVILSSTYYVDSKLTKFTDQGELLWSRTYSAINRPGLGKRNLLPTPTGYLMCGSGPQGRFTLIKTDAEGNAVTNQDPLIPAPHTKISHYPNPVIDRVTIKYETEQPKRNLKVELYNIRGQKLLSVPINDCGNTGEIELDP
ncbi:MAG: hypothetical protein ACOYIS_07580, partial [Candidatus Cloacimonadaceae bacterium]